MYIMSQDGTRLAKLTALEIAKTSVDGMFAVYLCNVDFSDARIAKYPTEPEAKAQLLGISRALLEGRPIYCFD